MKTESETTGNLDSQQADPNEHDSKSLIPRHPEHIQSQSQRIIAASNPLRRGKWTPEEEAYALAAIRDFNSGFLDAPPGTTLRTYLSEKLQCDPMRITKKFTGEASIGKKVSNCVQPWAAHRHASNIVHDAEANPIFFLP